MGDPSDTAHAGDGAEFGTALRRARLRARLTQDQLAHRSGLSARTISDLECGRVARPRNSSLDLLVAALAGGEELRATLVRAVSAADEAREPARAQLPGASLLAPEPAPRPALLPRELPAAAPDFTGREHEQAVLAGRASAVTGPDGDAPLTVLLTGAPGVGKTALAVRFGHVFSAGSPIPRLFVELGGTSCPLAPDHALRQMLPSLGVSDSHCPADLEGKVRMFRSLLYGRRAVIVLDDAAGESQLRPLLPAGPGCVVVITSRRTLEGLSPTIRMPLDVLPYGQALSLLGTVAGPRLDTGEAAAGQLVRLCGRLPLALRIAGNQLAVRPHWSPARLVARLLDERTRLELLTAGDLAVLRTFDGAYQQLSSSARVIFARLGLLRCGNFTPRVLDALGDQAQPAWPVVDELAGASLIRATAPDRYHIHHLLRLYARGKLAEQDAPEQIEAVRHRVARLPR